MIDELIKKNRSFRSFTDKTISNENLMSMLECGRLGATAKNIQGIKYIVINSKEMVDSIFPYTSWAGAIKWNPTISEGPTSYIAMCTDTEVPLPEKLFYFNMGIASQNILLKASESGFGGCLLGAFNKKKVTELLDIDEERYTIEVLIALGDPNEKIKLVDTEDDFTSYYRDDKNIHYVPKKILSKLIIKHI